MCGCRFQSATSITVHLVEEKCLQKILTKMDASDLLENLEDIYVYEL